MTGWIPLTFYSINMLILYFFLINIYISESLALSCLECQILNKFVLSGLLNPTVINYGISLVVLETRMKLRRCIRWRNNSSKIRKHLLTLLLFVTFPLPSTNLAFFIFENTIWLISPEEGEVGCGGPGYDSIKRKWKFLLLTVTNRITLTSPKATPKGSHWKKRGQAFEIRKACLQLGTWPKFLVNINS